EEREVRYNFLLRALDIGKILHADALSFWSGTSIDPANEIELPQRLVSQCQRLHSYAADRQIRLAFEPEPGMFVDTMSTFHKVYPKSSKQQYWGLTIDIGHLHCLSEPIEENLRLAKDSLFNIHIEDMRRGVHDHLMFGEGEIDFAPVFRTLKE